MFWKIFRIFIIPVVNPEYDDDLYLATTTYIPGVSLFCGTLIALRTDCTRGLVGHTERTIRALNLSVASSYRAVPNN